MALGQCSNLFSEGVTSWDETQVSAANGTSFHFPFWELWYMLVSVCFHNLVTYAQKLQDLYSACLMFWMRTHTGPQFIVSSEGRESHQPQVIWASHTNSKILVPDGARTPNLSHWSRTRYHCATGSIKSPSSSFSERARKEWWEVGLYFASWMIFLCALLADALSA
jgi:hypothetical protein